MLYRWEYASSGKRRCLLVKEWIERKRGRYVQIRGTLMKYLVRLFIHIAVEDACFYTLVNFQS